MPEICPLCGQPLPKSIDEQSLHAKLDRLTSRARQAEKRELEQQFTNRLSQRLAAERTKIEKQAEQKAAAKITRAVAETERSLRREISEAWKEKAAVEKRHAAEVSKIRKESEQSARRQTTRAIQDVISENERKLTKLQDVKEKEHARHELEIARLQGKLEEFSRKLEQGTPGRYGEEGEVDLFSELKREFSGDKIERVGRGVKGADILHKVLDGSKEAGCIVYECKNVSTWNKAFVTQAKKYYTQYDTPYVMIVSRSFPRKKRGMCVVGGLPIIEPCFAIALASVIRDGIIEIAKLRLTRTGTNSKAQELFAYVVANEFQARFREISEASETLRSLQQTEQNWHERHWAAESDLHAKIQKRHREIDAKLHLIAKGGRERAAISIAAVGR